MNISLWTRIKIAVNVLRGRPTIFRWNIVVRDCDYIVNTGDQERGSTISHCIFFVEGGSEPSSDNREIRA